MIRFNLKEFLRSDFDCYDKHDRKISHHSNQIWYYNLYEDGMMDYCGCYIYNEKNNHFIFFKGNSVGEDFTPLNDIDFLCLFLEVEL